MTTQATESGVSTRLGTVQGAAQASVVALLMWIGSADFCLFDEAHGTVRTEAFGPVLLAIVVTLVALGAWIDLRRTTPLVLEAPLRARWVVFALGALLPLVPAVVAGAPLLAYVCLGCVASPYALVTLDRIVGPLWVLASLARRARARSRWPRYLVIEAGESRAIMQDERGEDLSVRTDVTLEPGLAYLELATLPLPAEPYRTDDVRVVVRQSERIAERKARSRDIVTAALALVSGLAWLALPFSVVLGDALAERVYPEHWY